MNGTSRKNLLIGIVIACMGSCTYPMRSGELPSAYIKIADLEETPAPAQDMLDLIQNFKQKLTVAQETYLEPIDQIPHLTKRKIALASIGQTALVGAGVSGLWFLQKAKTRFIFELPFLANLTAQASAQILTTAAGVIGTGLVIYKLNRLVHAECRSDIERLQERYAERQKLYHGEVNKQIESLCQQFVLHKTSTSEEVEKLRANLETFLHNQAESWQKVSTDIAATQQTNQELKDKVQETISILTRITQNPILHNTQPSPGTHAPEKHSWFKHDKEKHK